MKVLMLVLGLLACKKSESPPPSQLATDVEALWRACEGGTGKSCLELDEKLAGHESLEGKQRSEAVKLRRTYNTDRLLRHACNGGEAVACYEKGKRAISRGVPVEFVRGCELGHAPSCDEVERRRRAD